MNEVFSVLYKNICNISEPRQWFAIVILVYLIYEWKQIVRIWIDKEDPLYHRPKQEILFQLLLSEHQKRLFLVILTSIVSWCLFFELFFYANV